MKNTNQTKAYLFALLAVIFWSTMSSAFKITLRYIAFDQMLLWSALYGIVTLGTIKIITNKSLKIKGITKKDLKSSAIMGFVNPFLYYIILFKAYDLLEAQIAGTLNYAWPIALVLLSIPFLHQKIKPVSLVAIFISFLGLVIISTQGQLKQFALVNPLGVALALGSAVFWAIYWILNMKDNREEVGKILLNLCFGFIYVLVYLLIVHGKISLPKAEALPGVVYIGMFEMSITFVIWLKALQFSQDTAKVSNLIYLSPFLALFIIRYAVGEQIHMATIVGLVVIVAGIVLQQISGNRKQNKPEIKG